MKYLYALLSFLMIVPFVPVTEVRAQSEEASGSEFSISSAPAGAEKSLDSFVVTFKDERGSKAVHLSGDVPDTLRTSETPGFFAAAMESGLERKMDEYRRRDDVASVQPNYIYRTAAWKVDFANEVANPWDYGMGPDGNSPLSGQHWYYELGGIRGMWYEQGCGMGDPDCGGDPDVTVAVIDTGLAFETYTALLRGDSYAPFPGMFDGAKRISLYENIGEEPTDPSPNKNVNKVDDDSNGYRDDYNGLDAWVYDFCYPVEVDDPPCTNQEWGDEGHPNDDVGHGTFVTGLITTLIDDNNNSPVDYDNSISPAHNVTILPIKANFPQSNSFSTSSLIAAIDYAIYADADVINMSLSGGIDDSALHAKIQEADSAGILVVAASGNNNSAVGYPARYSEVFAVGAVNSNKSRSCYSNYGAELDVVAYVEDGDDTFSCYSASRTFGKGTAVWQGSFPCFFSDTCDGLGGDFLNFSMGHGVGTSFAAPQVAALAAVILSFEPGFSNAQLRSYIEDNADNSVGIAGDDVLTGQGAINFNDVMEDINGLQGDGVPSITVTDPVGDNDSADTTYTVTWDGTDPDTAEGSMRLNFFLDSDTSMVSYIAPLPGCQDADISTVLGSGQTCTANLSGFPNGTYYLLGCIRDAFSTSCDHSGSLTVGNSDVSDSGITMATVDGWKTVNFSTSFSTPPVVIANVSDEYGSDMVYVEVRNVTTGSFEVLLRENTRTGYNNLHTPEEVSWFAVQNSTDEIQVGTVDIERNLSGFNPDGWIWVDFPVAFATTPDVYVTAQEQAGGDLEYADIRNVSTTRFQIRMEEAPGYDGNHWPETYGWVAMESYSGADRSGTLSAVNHNWQTVTFSPALTYLPAVIAEIQSENGGDSAQVDIRNLSSTGFQIRVEEDPLYYDPFHANEQIKWFAIEQTPDLSYLLGTTSVTHNKNTVVFDKPFPVTPAIIADIQTENGGDTSEVDIHQVWRGAFTLRIEEDPKLWDGGHTAETVGYLAYPLMDTADNQEIYSGTEFGFTSANQNWVPVTFESSFSSVPKIFATIQTEFGSDTAEVDIRNITQTGFEVRVEEDVFAGWDGNHAFERIAWAAFETPFNGDAGLVSLELTGIGNNRWVTLDGSTTLMRMDPLAVRRLSFTR
ncbi:MAG: Subtilisin DY [candidate division WS6 bacterium OLB20]|uniref:Subtilisin DY n=1 Tax=candidate division WS6 bacterium OLB20 TaxID=1617426 RepID=A0A136LZJ9_9BACT|nr:MAG: Subtilisin DY [candidate division WS6 bacterium OLB20]